MGIESLASLGFIALAAIPFAIFLHICFGTLKNKDEE